MKNSNVGARLIAGNQDRSQRAEAQDSSLQPTAAPMEPGTATVKQNAHGAQPANPVAHSTSDVAPQGGRLLGEEAQTRACIRESSKNIADLMPAIDAIAFQANILALNAAVDAARGGRQGSGFVVVAADVHRFAQRSASAAREIKALIAPAGRIGAGCEPRDEGDGSMRELFDSVRRVSDIMAEIAAATKKQTRAIEQVNLAIAQLGQLTQQTAALVQKAAAAAQTMCEQATSILEAVQVFKLDAESEARRIISQAKATSKAVVLEMSPPAPAALAKVPIAAPNRLPPDHGPTQSGGSWLDF